MSRYAVIGDPHGCSEEYRELLDRLEWISLDGILVSGDMVDRGPDSAGVVAMTRERKIKAILGNHEESILSHYDRVRAGGHLPRNPEKARTIAQMGPEEWAFLRSLPRLHVLDDVRTVVVHGGLWPGLPLHRQPDNIVRAQLIHMDPANAGRNRWWGAEATRHPCELTEEQSRFEGWERWYRLYDWDYDVVYGHSVWAQPFVHRNPGCGRTIGVDTGSCFGGSITAAIIGDGDPWFVSVKAKKIWYDLTHRSLWET